MSSRSPQPTSIALLLHRIPGRTIDLQTRIPATFQVIQDIQDIQDRFLSRSLPLLPQVHSIVNTKQSKHLTSVHQICSASFEYLLLNLQNLTSRHSLHFRLLSSFLRADNQVGAVQSNPRIHPQQGILHVFGGIRKLTAASSRSPALINRLRWRRKTS